MTPAYVVSPLAPSHELGAFDCGVPELGYFAITPTQVASDDLPSRLRGAGRIQGGYLLARLALHRDLRGGDLGRPANVSRPAAPAPDRAARPGSCDGATAVGVAHWTQLRLDQRPASPCPDVVRREVLRVVQPDPYVARTGV